MQSCSRHPPTPSPTHICYPLRDRDPTKSRTLLQAMIFLELGSDGNRLVDKYLWIKTKSDLQLATLKLLWLDSVISGNAISKSIKVYIIHDYNSMSRPTGCSMFFDHGGTFNKFIMFFQSIVYYDFSFNHFQNLWSTNHYIISNEYFFHADIKVIDTILIILSGKVCSLSNLYRGTIVTTIRDISNPKICMFSTSGLPTHTPTHSSRLLLIVDGMTFCIIRNHD